MFPTNRGGGAGQDQERFFEQRFVRKPYFLRGVVGLDAGGAGK